MQSMMRKPQWLPLQKGRFLHRPQERERRLHLDILRVAQVVAEVDHHFLEERDEVLRFANVARDGFLQNVVGEYGRASDCRIYWYNKYSSNPFSNNNRAEQTSQPSKAIQTRINKVDMRLSRVALGDISDVFETETDTVIGNNFIPAMSTKLISAEDDDELELEPKLLELLELLLLLLPLPIPPAWASPRTRSWYSATNLAESLAFRSATFFCSRPTHNRKH
jgi:hypothetical protein